MADGGFREFEAVLGALSKMTSDEAPDAELLDARCPKCEAASFVKVTDLFDQARARLDEPVDDPNTPRDGGLTDARIVGRFAPPQRRSAVPRIVAAAIVFGGIAFAVYHYFGNIPGQFTGMAAGVATAIVALTSLRKFSDEYYDHRKRWRSLFMCRKCGQLVAP